MVDGPTTSRGAGMPPNIQCTGTDLGAGAAVMAGDMTENSEASAAIGEALPRAGILMVLPRLGAPETWILLPAVLLLLIETGTHLEMNIIKLDIKLHLMNKCDLQ